MKFIEKFLNLPESAKASVAYAICSMMQRCLSFITLPLFTRLLTPEQFGQVTIYTSWSALLGVFISLYLPYGTFSKAMIKFEDDRDGYIASVDAICLCLGSVFLAAYYPLRDQLSDLFQLPTILLIFMTVEIVANTAIQCWMAKQRFDYKFKSVIVVTLLMTLLAPMVSVFAVMSFEEKGYARIVGTASVGIIVGAFFWGRNLYYGKCLYRKRFWQYALSFNIPLIPYYLAQMIYNHSDRIMISHFEGTDKAGIYGVAYNLAMALSFVLTSINNSYVPWLFRQIKEGQWHRTRSVSAFISIIITLMLMLVILLAPELVYLMAGKEYREAIWCIPPIAMSLLMMWYGGLFINVEFYYEKKGYLVLGMICSGLLNIILNYLLIPRFGFISAAYTTLCSFAITVIINYVFYKKILQENCIEDVMYDYWTLILMAGGLFFAGLAVMIVYEKIIVRCFVVACIIILFILKKRMILDYVNKMKG